MIALTAALAVALSLGAGEASARPAPNAPGRAQQPTLSNAQRARVGLLPRKPARKVTAAKQNRRGRRIITTVSHAPTFLPEPIPLAEALEYAEVGAAADAPAVAAAPGEGRDLRVAAASVVTDVTIVLRYAP